MERGRSLFVLPRRLGLSLRSPICRRGGGIRGGLYKVFFVLRFFGGRFGAPAESAAGAQACSFFCFHSFCGRFALVFRGYLEEALVFFEEFFFDEGTVAEVFAALFRRGRG